MQATAVRCDAMRCERRRTQMQDARHQNAASQPSKAQLFVPSPQGGGEVVVLLSGTSTGENEPTGSRPSNRVA